MRVPRAVVVVAVLFSANLPIATVAQQGANLADAPTYRNDARGLERFMSDLLQARSQKKDDAYKQLSHSLLLPESTDWFVSTFGEDDGKKYAEQYEKTREQVPQVLDRTLDTILKNQFKVYRAHRFEKLRDENATPEQYPVLALRVKDVPIFDVTFRDKAQLMEQRLWALAYVNGAFRFVGDLRSVEPTWPETKNPTAGVALVTPKVDESKLIHIEQAVYPAKAKTSHIEGIVRLWALIDPKGNVVRTRVQEGHCWLAEAAAESVMKWRYTPTLVGGIPCYVIANVRVDFRLGR